MTVTWKAHMKGVEPFCLHDSFFSYMTSLEIDKTLYKSKKVTGSHQVMALSSL